MIADDGQVEDLENEYKKIREQEREEFNQQQKQKQQHFEDLYLLENEDMAINDFNNNVNSYKNNEPLYDRQYSTGTQNDELSQSYTFDLPDYILSNNNNSNNKERPRSRTPSRIPTPVRNKTATSYKTGSSTAMGHYLRNPSPLTIGSRIPILVTSRPQSRADMYPPVNDQQAVTTKSPKTDLDASLSEYDKKNYNKCVDDNGEIHSNIIDQIYFRRTENFNDSGNKNEISNLLDEGLPDGSLLTGVILNSNTNEKQHSFDATNATLNDIQTTTFGGGATRFAVLIYFKYLL